MALTLRSLYQGIGETEEIQKIFESSIFEAGKASLDAAVRALKQALQEIHAYMVFTWFSPLASKYMLIVKLQTILTKFLCFLKKSSYLLAEV